MDDLGALLSDEGWPYASAPPVEPGDPGRFHALFGRDSLITALQVLPDRPEVARATHVSPDARMVIGPDQTPFLRIDKPFRQRKRAVSCPAQDICRRSDTETRHRTGPAGKVCHAWMEKSLG